MNRSATAFVVAVTICIAGCGLGRRTYVPPAAGEPQATIRGHIERGLACTDAFISLLFDDQMLPFRYSAGQPMPISTGSHTANIQGKYGAWVPPSIFTMCLICFANLQFTAEPSHDYQLVLVKEGAPYHIDLLDFETNQPVASAPCPGGFQTGKQPPAPKPDTGTGFMETH